MRTQIPNNIGTKWLLRPLNSATSRLGHVKAACRPPGFGQMQTGTCNIMRLCLKAEPFESTFAFRDGFVLTIARPHAEQSKLTVASTGKSTGKIVGRSAPKIIRLIQKNPQKTIPEMASRLSVTESAIEKRVRKLLEQEIIGRVGPAEGGYWEILQ